MKSETEKIMYEVRKNLRELENNSHFMNATRKNLRQEKTKCVKIALCCAVRAALSDTRDLFICANGIHKQYVDDQREWLYDVACLKFLGKSNDKVPLKKERRFLKSVPMVAECEWANHRGVRNDFRKLMVARADIRIMVYNGFKDREHRGDFEILETLVRESKINQIDDIYLFAALRKDHYDYKKSRFEFKTVVAS